MKKKAVYNKRLALFFCRRRNTENQRQASTVMGNKNHSKMRYIIVQLIIVLITLSACNETSSPDEINNDQQQLSLEIQQKDSVIFSLQRELDSLKSANSDNKIGLCYASKNKLYGVIQPEKIDCSEFAELLNWMDTTINYFNGDYSISITKSCNGPSDYDIEACNCSNNFYISTGSEELPKTYDLYRVGPYRKPTNIQFLKKDQILKFNYLDKKDQTQVATIKINRHSISVLK